MLKFEVGTELVIGGLYTNDYLVRVVAREENRVQVQEVEYPDSDPDWHEIDVDAERDAERFLNWEYRGIKSYVYPDSTPEKVYGGGDEGPEQKRLCITYHMKRPNEGAETCITLPMTVEIAESILRDGADSPYLSPICNGDVYRILACLSNIQGYQFDQVCMVEEVELC